MVQAVIDYWEMEEQKEKERDGRPLCVQAEGGHARPELYEGVIYLGLGWKYFDDLFGKSCHLEQRRTKGARSGQ